CVIPLACFWPRPRALMLERAAPGGPGFDAVPAAAAGKVVPHAAFQPDDGVRSGVAGLPAAQRLRIATDAAALPPGIGPGAAGRPPFPVCSPAFHGIPYPRGIRVPVCCLPCCLACCPACCST